MVKYSAICKSLIVLSVFFIASSIAELIVGLIFINIKLNFNGEKILIKDMLLTTDYLSIDGFFAVICLLIILCCYILLGIAFYIIGKRKSIEELLFAKHFLIIGMLLFILTFTKLEYLVILGNLKVSIDENYTFQTALYSKELGAYPIGGALWFFFISVACEYCVIAIVTSGTALKWIIEIENKRKEEII